MTRQNGQARMAAHPSPNPPRAGARQNIDIRMYNVGFGDCFLFACPYRDDQKKILIDCGSIKKAKLGMDRIVKEVIANLTSDGTAHVDFLIASHRHRDHISGYADARWRDVTVGEVWMPWIEDPGNQEARRIRIAQQAFTAALDRFLELKPGTVGREAKELVRNAQSNAQALDMLHTGFKGNPRRRYLPKRKDFEEVHCELLPGIRIYALGPSRDADVRRWMEPLKDGDAYLAALQTDSAAYDEEDGVDPVT